MVFINFRADRMRQIVETFGIERHVQSDVQHPAGLHIATMTQYKAEFPMPVLFPKQSMKNVLAEWLASQGLSQFHCAGKTACASFKLHTWNTSKIRV